MSLFTNSIKGALRLGQTSRTLSTTGAKWLLGDRPPPPKLLRQTFEKLGTTYIKLGQFIASSPSLFPDEYVEEFQHCLDNTPPIPFSTIKKLLIKELDKPPYQIFSEIDPTPLATASIAQVHAAKLITGEDVVIKVQKPGVKNILLTDLNFLYVSARLLETIVPKLSMASLADIVDEIQKGMLEECDFFKEAKNIADFNQFLKDTGNNDVVAPKVYKQASSLRVLTMERFHGVPFTDLDSIKDYVEDPQQVLITAMNTWFSSLMLSQSFHADVHAGNMMILKDGRIGFIDFGIVGRIKPETWSSVTLFIQSISDGDYHGMAKSMLGIGITKEKINLDALAKDIEKLYQSVNTATTMPARQDTIDDKDVNKAMMDLLGIGKRYGIHFPREFALLLKQILYFDRYVQLISPDQNIYSDDRLVMLADPTPDY
ncbi:MAG: AarF/ABC1/UbiB kinase family protein [Pseudomonadales bacterium]|nr:AarF/ABC1/UbiB kinase family protein [Pseudomonadales bacterium]